MLKEEVAKFLIGGSARRLDQLMLPYINPPRYRHISLAPASGLSCKRALAG